MFLQISLLATLVCNAVLIVLNINKTEVISEQNEKIKRLENNVERLSMRVDNLALRENDRERRLNNVCNMAVTKVVTK